MRHHHKHRISLQSEASFAVLLRQVKRVYAFEVGVVGSEVTAIACLETVTGSLLGRNHVPWVVFALARLGPMLAHSLPVGAAGHVRRRWRYKFHTLYMTLVQLCNVDPLGCAPLLSLDDGATAMQAAVVKCAIVADGPEDGDVALPGLMRKALHRALGVVLLLLPRRHSHLGENGLTTLLNVGQIHERGHEPVAASFVRSRMTEVVMVGTVFFANLVLEDLNALPLVRVCHGDSCESLLNGLDERGLGMCEEHAFAGADIVILGRARHRIHHAGAVQPRRCGRLDCIALLVRQEVPVNEDPGVPRQDLQPATLRADDARLRVPGRVRLRQPIIELWVGRNAVSVAGAAPAAPDRCGAADRRREQQQRHQGAQICRAWRAGLPPHRERRAARRRSGREGPCAAKCKDCYAVRRRRCRAPVSACRMHR
mmetsp:Transcript_19849/g.58983  ORF Transcript_19849/g.58983 Transcript_19849/m.58983 type:complete len:426 (+) Transcript_19849:185-1462(+)